MGWTKLRFFAPANLNHMFMMAPIDEAIEWLDAMNGRDERKSLTLASKWARDGEWGWVWHVVKVSRSAALQQRAAEDAAQKAVATMAEALKGKPADWIPKWVEFWRVHGETNAAKLLIANYLALRDQQRATAVGQFTQSQVHFRSGNRDEGFKVLEKLRGEAPNTYQGYFAWKWLSERK